MRLAPVAPLVFLVSLVPGPEATYSRWCKKEEKDERQLLDTVDCRGAAEGWRIALDRAVGAAYDERSRHRRGRVGQARATLSNTTPFRCNREAPGGHLLVGDRQFALWG